MAYLPAAPHSVQLIQPPPWDMCPKGDVQGSLSFTTAQQFFPQSSRPFLICNKLSSLILLLLIASAQGLY